MPNQQHKLSLEELTNLGEKFYFDELQDKLEKEHWDDYAVIDVEQKKYRVDEDQLELHCTKICLELLVMTNHRLRLR